ncbi:BREX system Lon protease-like protein BrxL [Bifidobacterium pseudolongum]|uniref:BREX system Lon protease-like protein BrxL n=1 Tax=Bifidobacterium pseudolongum TaxID=1694 RepID=UPI0010D857EA|nr:BREX system Lon protease-like protein BrxL [Bifidobacterium pseudolongum]RYP96100.1 ATP-dependent Lon protease [Bifidobacterium pseudolongum subsp. globosum]
MDEMTDDTQHELSPLDRKITDVFPQHTVRKDLVGDIKGNAVVPTYVLEFLLSQFATTTDALSIESGVQRVQEILAQHYVHRDEATLIQSKIREKGHYRIIDKVQVSLNERLDRYEASFSNLNIRQVVVDPEIVKKNEKLLVTGIWCICRIGYAYTGEKDEVPWRLDSLKPVQMATDDVHNFIEGRKSFSTEEWIDLLMQSIGFNPELFSDRAKLLLLVRMIPFVERNFNVIELGPKGTGKSHIYSEFSPHGMLISGGEISVAKLFVNNATGRVGLVGFWDTVAFDEFAGRSKKAGKELVDIMKNYMANKTFSRGVEQIPGEASLVFVGNTDHDVPTMLKHSDLFEALPPQYHDPAFLDRIHAYIPGWEFEQIRSEMFTDGYGFVVDYLAEVLHNLRDLDYSDRFNPYFELSSSLSTRDKDGIRKTFSGLMKLVYPSGEASAEQIEPLLRLAIEGRKRVKDQLCRIDTTMTPVDFAYTKVGAETPITVKTFEEIDYPKLYWRQHTDDDESDETIPEGVLPEAEEQQTTQAEEDPSAAQPTLSPLERRQALAKPGEVTLDENDRGWSYNKLFGPYVAGVQHLELTDPYIRVSHQMRNLAEFLEMVRNNADPHQPVHVHLITKEDGDVYRAKQQLEMFAQLKHNYAQMGIELTFAFDDTIHDRELRTDTGWKISLGRGLDIFQRYSDKDWLNPETRIQQMRRIKSCTFIYRRDDDVLTGKEMQN